MADGVASGLDLRLVPAALTAWAVSAAGIALGAGPVLTVVCGVIALAGGLARGLGGGPAVLRSAGLGVLGAAVIGAGFGVAVTLRTQAVERHPLRGAVGTTLSLTLRPTESPRPVAGGRLMVRAALIEADGSPMSGQVTMFASGAGFADLTAGRPVTVRARIARPSRRDLTVAVCTAVGRPVFGPTPAVARAAHAVRSRFAAAARAALPPPQAAVLPGLVLGDTSAVTAATTAEFRTAGLTHLTAVSGANVTIVCGAVLFCARLVGPRAAVALAGLALVAFVVVVQPTPSVLRAAVMGALALLAVLSARRRQAVPALAATVITLMVFAPQLAVDVGFALSVSATAALVLLAPVWTARLVARGWPEPLAAAVCVACAAHLVTAPLVAAISGRLSLVAVAANVLVAVIIPPITVLGTAAAALGPLWPDAAGLLIRFTGPLLWWLLNVAHIAAALPGAAVAVPAGWAGLVIVAACPVLAALAWRLARSVGRS